MLIKDYLKIRIPLRIGFNTMCNIALYISHSFLLAFTLIYRFIYICKSVQGLFCNIPFIQCRYYRWIWIGLHPFVLCFVCLHRTYLNIQLNITFVYQFLIIKSPKSRWRLTLVNPYPNSQLHNYVWMRIHATYRTMFLRRRSILKFYNYFGMAMMNEWFWYYIFRHKTLVGPPSYTVGSRV